MKLSFGDDVDAFRQEFRTWLEANRPSAEEMAAEPPRSSSDLPAWARRWTRQLFDAGWLVPGWPPELGGRDAGPVETLVYLEELRRAGVPRTTNPQGLGIVAPSVLDYGTPEQIERYAMPLLRGERSACLGMSEPGAGSDLAALSTRAVLDGDHFVVNGQKLWTSGAHDADFCFLFCRTDTSVPKHKGISILLVDMDTPGVTPRPFGDLVDPEMPDLNEVFLTDVIVSRDNLVGEMNNGWAMANGSLAHERGMVWIESAMKLEEEMARALADAPAVLADRHPDERGAAAETIVRSYVDVVAARCLGYRGFAKLVRGGTAPEQALMKAFSSEAAQRLSMRMADLSGDAEGTDTREFRAISTLSLATPPTWAEAYWHTFGGTISAGSSEVQRNIIAEKVLGLPRG
jgi:alkylation response protein AidB-like acyl-CoA dehydrogenase